MKKVLNFILFFGSLSTLLCCALPFLLVVIGLGSSFASFTSIFPQVYWLTEHKGLIFVITGFFLTASLIFNKMSLTKSCPYDVEKKQMCENYKKKYSIIFKISLVFYAMGLFFSYILPRVVYG